MAEKMEEKLERVGESGGVEVVVVGVKIKKCKSRHHNKCGPLIKSLGSCAWVLGFKTWS